MSQIQKNSKKLQNSDSDYKAEDEGSASDNQSWKKYKKLPYNLKMTKKQMIQHSIRSLTPIGITLKHQNRITEHQYEELMRIDDAIQIVLNFKCFMGKVLEVIDGETLKIVIWHQGKPIKTICRLNGVNAPQIKKGEAKQFGNYVKKVLTQMVLNKIVKIQTGEYDKMGRLFCRVYAHSASPLSYLCSKSQFCINDYLIQHDMAKGTSRCKHQFSKRDYQIFLQRYQGKIWPIVQSFPFFTEHQEIDYEEKQEEDDQ